MLISFAILLSFQSILVAYVIKLKSLKDISLIESLKGRPLLRIIDGVPASLGDVPYQAAFRCKSKNENFYYVTFCGGTIVKETVIISAAHCFEDKRSSCCETKGSVKSTSVKHVYAVAGTLLNKAYYSTDNSNGQWRKLSSVKYPQNYNFPNDDIALVKTQKPFIFNKYVSAIPYARSDQNISGLCKISGYGQLSDKITSDYLLFGYTNVIPEWDCMTLLRRNMSHLYCTDSALALVHKGDSGGPLVCTGTQDPRESSSGILVGVTSAKVDFSMNGMTIFRSGLFTKVSSYTEFLNISCEITSSVPIICVCLFTVLLNSSCFTCFSNFNFQATKE